jgi:ribosomal protein S18 acetylase RimI-like enzyme
VRGHGIRELTADDAGPYAALRLRMLREYAQAFTSSYEDDADKPLAWVQKRIAHDPEAPHNFVLGAFADDAALIGSVGLCVEGRIKQRHKALLFGMFVAPGAMYRGVGRSLLDHCIGRAATIPGLEQITLTVTATNGRALRFYEAAGFRSFGIEERALKIADAYYPKAHMVLYLRRPVGQDR